MTRGKRKQPAGYGEHGKPIVPTPCLHIWFAAKGVSPDFMETRDQPQDHERAAMENLQRPCAGAGDQQRQ
jgi:hypothetical protein